MAKFEWATWLYSEAEGARLFAEGEDVPAKGWRDTPYPAPEPAPAPEVSDAAVRATVLEADLAAANARVADLEAKVEELEKENDELDAAGRKVAEELAALKAAASAPEAK